jgi:Ca2+-transporting ATPase
LPAILTVVLAIGVWRMAKRRAVVRHVPSVETLGETDVICTDKTGTLTRNQMTVRNIFLFGLDVRVGGEGYDPKGDFTTAGRPLVPAEIPQLSLLLKAAALGSSATVVRKDDHYTVVGDPTEGALTVLAAKAGYDRRSLEGEWRVIDEMPFSSVRKLRAALVERVDYSGKRSRMIFAVGALESLAARSIAYLEETPKAMDRMAKDRFERANAGLASKARRVVALSMKEVPEATEEIKESDLEDMTLLGLAGMLDPPRPEAAKAISRCRQAGIRVIMITGDQKQTALAIAREVGLVDPEAGEEQVFDENQVFGMSETEFESCLSHAAVFARVTPQTKLRLVAALKRQGHVVAMTGDGVNDAPALKKSDIGIAMGRNGTDVAREVSDMILLDDNFATIVNAVEEGRVVLRNVKQTTAYLFTTNMAEAVTILLALVFGLPAPLLAGQILWMNLVTDGFPDVALSTEPAGDGVLAERPPRRGRSLITPNVMLFAVISSLVMCAVTLSMFAWSLGDYGDLTRARTVAFTAMCFFQLWNVFNFRSATASLFHLGLSSNRYVLWAVAFSFLLQLAVVYLPFLNRTFRVVPLGWREMVVIVSVTVLVIPAVEGYKWLLRRGLIPERWV